MPHKKKKKKKKKKQVIPGQLAGKKMSTPFSFVVPER